MTFPLLDIRGLKVSFPGHPIVQGIDLSVSKGEVVALVGQTGSGKSSVARAIPGIFPQKPVSLEGKILFEGQDLLSLNDRQLQQIRGTRIGMIFQDPLTALNPTMKVGHQIAEVLKLKDPSQAYTESVQFLQLLGMPQPHKVLREYPHTLSGGMRQRVMMAIALIAHPHLLIADEPTTALDMPLQIQALALLKQVQKKMDMGILLITHDLRLVSSFCDRVYIMQEGKIVETNTTKHLFAFPQHSLTKELLGSIPPKPSYYPPSVQTEPLVKIQHLCKKFDSKTALDDLSLTLYKGEILGLVGESGCGKSTLAKILAGLELPSSGEVLFSDSPIHSVPRKKIQMVFQDPYSSLNPRMTVREILAEPFRIHRIEHCDMDLGKLLSLVQLSNAFLSRFPYELSGGQRQRVGIARALALQPELLICDEPISALDASVGMQILDLLKDLQKNLSLTVLFISHDLHAVRYLSSRIAVLYLGSLIEVGSTQAIYDNPAHLYTRNLFLNV